MAATIRPRNQALRWQFPSEAPANGVGRHGATEIDDPGAPHGLTATHQDKVNADLLAFIKS